MHTGLKPDVVSWTILLPGFIRTQDSLITSIFTNMALFVKADILTFTNIFTPQAASNRVSHIVVTTRTTRTPAFWGYPPLPHDYPYHWVILDPKSKEDKVKVTNLKNSPKFRHTFWSCLIRYANMKWIRWLFLKIQSGHDSVHRRTDRRTDGQGDTSIPPFQFRWSGGIIRPFSGGKREGTS